MCKCGYSSEVAKSTGSHMRYCDEKTPKEHQYQYKCPLCKFSSQSKNGLAVHNSRAHKEVYNESLKEKEKGYRWTTAELEYLAKTIRQLKKDKVRRVNKVAGEKIGRTEQAVQKIRTSTEYKQAEQRVRKKDQEKEETKRDEANQQESQQGVESQYRVKRQESQDEDIRNICEEIPVKRKSPTPTVIRRQLPVVPPTPIQADNTISQVLLTQNNLSIHNTSNTRRWSLPITPTAMNRGRVLLNSNVEPDYKRTAYLDACSYAATLGSDTDLDKIVKSYLEGQTSWTEVTKVTASEENKVKKHRKQKEPWMKNRRENRNTRKARIYQFTQKAYEQNRKATINKIINGTFSLDNQDQTVPNIEKVEETYVERLEQGNQMDETEVEFPEEVQSTYYGKLQRRKLSSVWAN